MSRLKLMVYAIAKDEVRHVARFMDAARDADLVVVADTGSTDGTVEELQRAGGEVHSILISPWRFDDARNAALALLPADADVCISLDLDETLQPGWRAALERAWTPGATRLRYHFVASWNADGSPGVTFWNERIHARRGYRWRMPIHEVLAWCGEGDESVVWAPSLAVHHHPDESKSRGQYLPMLERLAREEPHDARAAHYLGREYYFAGRRQDAVRELRRQLALPGSTWAPQRAAACRMIGKCLDALHQPSEALPWYWQAVLERPQQREGWVDLCYALYVRGDFAGGYYAAEKALAILAPAPDYFREPEAWSALPHDLMSVCAWRIGLHETALVHARQAAQLAPGDDRIQANLQFLLDARRQAGAADDWGG